MAKKRRSAVDDVLGGESPIIGTLARQLTTERPPETPAESGGGVAAPEATEAPVAAPKPAERATKPKQSRPIKKTPKKRLVAANQAGGVRRAKRVLLSPEEESTVEELLMQLSTKAGVRVGFCLIPRARWYLLPESETTFGRVSSPSLSRPATQDADATAEFEEELKAWIIDVIQSMPRQQR